MKRFGRRGGSSGRSRVLLTGYFSFDGNVTTAGDLLAGEVAGDWLDRADVQFDVALAPKYGDGVDWERADPRDYTHLLWVCGPMTRGPRQTALRERFAACRLVALDVSRLDELGDWSPYHAIVERDSATVARPDISVLAGPERELPPVAGLALIAGQREYGERGRHDAVAEAFAGLIAARELAVVSIDTVIKPGRAGRRTPGEVEALLARMDVVLTNRLHGLALAIKHAVPVVAVDAVQGGAKLSRQGAALGWPVLGVESAGLEALQRGLDFCLRAEGRQAAAAARERALAGAAAVEAEFLAALGVGGQR